MALRQPVSTDVPCLSPTMKASCVRLTVHLASHSGTNPTKVWWKPGIRCTLIGKPYGRWGKSRYPVTVDCWVFPVAVSAVIFDAARSMLTTEVSI